MSSAIFGGKNSGFGSCSVPRGFEMPRDGQATLQCSLSVVASRARKWPEIPAGMIDLLCHDVDLDVLFQD